MEGERENNDEKQGKYFVFIVCLIGAVVTIWGAITTVNKVTTLMFFLAGIASVIGAFGWIYSHQESPNAFLLIIVVGILLFIALIMLIIYTVWIDPFI